MSNHILSRQRTFPGKSFNALALGIHLICAGAFLPLVAQAQTESVVIANQLVASKTNFNIPASSLATALNEFAAQSGLLISGNAQLTQGKASPGLSGSFTPQEALARLLNDSGLTYQVSEGKKIILEKKREVGQLQSVKVSAATLGSTTENSGSYTTGAMNSATKLNLTLRETPQSVTVITRQRMDDEGMVDMQDVIEKTPGLSVNSYGTGRPAFYARGFLIETVTEDGISSSFSSYIPSPLANLAMYDRAEIVRGSTGLMQGAGNPAAAVNLIRKRPTEEFQASISANAGSWNDFSTSADVSGSLTDDGSIRGRVVAYLQDGENFRDVEKEDRQLVYGTIDFDVTKNTTINLGLLSLDTDTNMVWGGIPVSPMGEHLDVPRSTFVAADWEYLTQDVKAVYASINHQFDNSWSLRLNVKRSNTVSDVLGTWLMPDEVNGNYSHIYWAAQDETDQLGADLYASGLVSLFGRNHELVLGAASNKEEVSNTEFFNCFDYSCGVSSNYDVFNPNPSAPVKPSFDPDSPYKSEGSAEVSQKSTYVTMRWNLADSVKLITGTRLDWYENIGPWSQTKEDKNPSFYGGLIYDFEKNHSAYLSYTDVFKPQDGKDINGKVLKPVVGKNYELGVKGEYFDGLLNTSIAIFRIDQANLAKRLADQSGCPTFPGVACVEATGLVRSEGIDLEIQGELSAGWEVGAGYTYSHAEYVRDSEADNEGKTLNTLNPESLFKINTTYTLPGDWNKWRIGGGATYQGDIYKDLDNGTAIVRNKQSAYVLADLMVGYKPTEHLSINARVNNLFDKTYYKAIADDIYYGAVEMYGEPRNVMVSAEYKF
ncbi:MAG: TonB-dependent siderophore receptor [Cellvibrio sp.]|uniref:TonB-dependent siderophore receptor n=1 Tax=Cellvibrio sp. TaxID=1965322 RepID=UPI0031A21886